MQGRLSPSQSGRLQFFPQHWEEEFVLARNMGFSHIDWFLDRDIKGFDPIYDVWMRSEVLEKIDSACSILPLNALDSGRFGLFGAEGEETKKIFHQLLPVLIPRLTSKIVTFALVEDLAPQSDSSWNEVRETIHFLAEHIRPLGARIALETELPASELLVFLDSLNDDSVGVCYDTGNTVSLGFDCPQDIQQLRERIISVHLKDRKKGSRQSLLLGTGSVPFPETVQALKELHFIGPYTLQAWRGDDYLADARTQLQFIQAYM